MALFISDISLHLWLNAANSLCDSISASISRLDNSSIAVCNPVMSSFCFFIVLSSLAKSDSARVMALFISDISLHLWLNAANSLCDSISASISRLDNSSIAVCNPVMSSFCFLFQVVCLRIRFSICSCIRTLASCIALILISSVCMVSFVVLQSSFNNSAFSLSMVMPNSCSMIARWPFAFKLKKGSV